MWSGSSGSGECASSPPHLSRMLSPQPLIERVGRRKLTIPQQWVCAVALVIIELWTSAPL